MKRTQSVKGGGGTLNREAINQTGGMEGPTPPCTSGEKAFKLNELTQKTKKKDNKQEETYTPEVLLRSAFTGGG